MLIALVLVAVLAVVSTPVTIYVVVRRDELMFARMMEVSAQMIDRSLNHAADIQSPGEPAYITTQRLKIAEQEIAARREIAAIQFTGDPRGDS